MDLSDYHIHIINLDNMRKFLKKIKNKMKDESLEGKSIIPPTFSFPTHNYMLDFRNIMDISNYYNLKIIPSYSLITSEGIEITTFVFQNEVNEVLEILHHERMRWIIFLLEELSYKKYTINPYDLSKKMNKKFHEIEKNDIAEYMFNDEYNNFYNLEEVYQTVLFELFNEFPFKQFNLDYIFNLKDPNCRYFLTDLEDEELFKKYHFDGLIHSDINVLNLYKDKGYNILYGSGRNIHFINDQEVDLIL